MRGRPIPVIIVSVLFILAGVIGFAYHIKDFFNPDPDLKELVWVLLLRIIALICGVLLLLRIKWARWLAIVWLLYHVVLSTFHTTSELITHIVLLVLVAVLLFLRVSNAYFNAE